MKNHPKGSNRRLRRGNQCGKYRGDAHKVLVNNKAQGRATLNK